MSKESIPLMPFYNTMTELLFADSNGAFPKAKEFNQEKKLGGFAIGVFREPGIDCRGTGFVVMLCSGVSSVIALILTAAHIFIREFQYDPAPLEFVIGLESYEAWPLKASLNWTDLSFRYYDPITNCPISIPEDWIVCELRQKPGNVYSSKLISLNLSDPTQSIGLGQKAKLIGFPKILDIHQLEYVSPEANRSQFNEVQQSLLGGNKLIVSKGEVMSASDMICTTCASVNGMSGSPLFTKANGQYTVIGILFGGPASPIHFFTSQILSNLSNPSKSYFDNLLSYIGGKKSQATSQNILNILNDYLLYINGMKQSINSRGITHVSANILLDLYSKALYLEFATGNHIKYNLCVPITKFHNEVLCIRNRYV